MYVRSKFEFLIQLSKARFTNFITDVIHKKESFSTKSFLFL